MLPMDNWPKKKRSEVMSKIRSKNTQIELDIRKMLYSMGYRYRLHVKGLPGKPDIVLNKYKTVIFIHGCFWHQHSGCRDGKIPKTRTVYWKEKLLKNKERDMKHIKELRKQGWKVLILWECEIEKMQKKVYNKLLNF
jgi:DNA mismatch endonuclease, patch repair protein